VGKDKSCCFIGHRKIEDTNDVEINLMKVIENLILTQNVNTFFWGSKSQFNDICKKVLKKLKEKYPHINRIYVRAEFPHINDDYKAYLLKDCDDTYYPERIVRAGKAAYVERNFEMIDKCLYCIMYFNEDYIPPMRKHSRRNVFPYKPNSGTKLSYDYAVKKGKKIINLFK